MHTTYKGLELLVDKKEWETKLKKKNLIWMFMCKHEDEFLYVQAQLTSGE